MSDDTRQARIEAAMDAFNAALQKETSCTLNSYWNQYECVPAMAAALDAADAVGRERVPEAAFPPMSVADAITERAYKDKHGCTREEGRKWQAVLKASSTAAPPERHDAPGVRVEDVSELFSAVVDDEGWQLCQDNPELIARIRAALTGQPDAKEEERR